jgi:hypothetical protein
MTFLQSSRLLSLHVVLTLLPLVSRAFIVPNPERQLFAPALSSSTTSPQQVVVVVPTKIYFDMKVANEPIGRLVFELTSPSPLPLHAENLVELCKKSRRAIDPLAHYVGCEFDFSPDYVQDGSSSGRYRWAHTCKGRGRNAVGRPGEAIIADPQNLRQCTHTCFGGQYYGDQYSAGYGDFGVVLTVPVAGPGRGTSRFSIVRVAESPPEWQERLLLNSGVVGKLVNPESMATLYRMARQRSGPPTIAESGVLE